MNTTDPDSVNTLFTFLTAKNSNVGGKKDLSKQQGLGIKFDIDRMAYQSSTKSQLAHIRQFKRFTKLLVSNIVDLFPQQKELTSCLVQEIINFSQCKMRLLRLGFTYIGMQILN